MYVNYKVNYKHKYNIDDWAQATLELDFGFECDVSFLAYLLLPMLAGKFVS